jgi:D-serine deaminase-like pyridoxal phosphate-dependent protein
VRWPDEIATPALVVERSVLEANLRAMAHFCQDRGLALRPHAKSHKCVEIARRQLELGAVGISVATVSEAEVFAAAGCADIFIAYPVLADAARARRLRDLAERARLIVGVDSSEGAVALGRHLRSSIPLEVMIEVECGLGRSGVPPHLAREVADTVLRSGLRIAGVFTFPGQGYAPGAAADAADAETRALQEAAEDLERAGIDCPVRSGGSTPTAAFTGAGANELRPGVYALNDAQQVALGTCEVTDVALFALCTVVSTPTPHRLVLDGGTKVLGTDRPPYVDGHGIIVGLPGAHFARCWEHHGVVELDASAQLWGQRLSVIPNHVCNAVNLADHLVVMEDAVVVDRWSVAARGANT